MSGSETSTTPTILDYLNADCWREVLQYVAIKDIILSERVSRQWRKVVLEYLQQYVRIGLKKEQKHEIYTIPVSNVNWFTLKEADCSSFSMWADKLGPSVVAAHCDSEQKLHIFGEKCPKLEAVTFYELPETVQFTKYESFKGLHRLCLSRWILNDIPEEVYSRYIANSPMIKHLQITACRLTGECFASIKGTNLTSLNIHHCDYLEFRYLLSAADRLSELTKLSLVDVPTETYNSLHNLLDKMPKLEHLLVYILVLDSRVDVVRADNFFKSVCRLSRLKSLGADIGGRDDDLDAVTRCCQELRSLELSRFGLCFVTSGGLAAVCRNAGARLTTLSVPVNGLTDDDVVDCVRACPNLQELDLRSETYLPYQQVTEAVVPRVRAARRPLLPRTLRFYMPHESFDYAVPLQDKSDGVTVRFDDIRTQYFL